ncbi:MAG: class I SAM-dependent methyltransferase [Candidatus Promineifilaceae bacterium]
MSPKTEEQLLAINRRFYAEFAQSFAESRGSPQPGFQRLLDFLPGEVDRVADVGCGNGRFGLFLSEHLAGFEYIGIDFTEGFLDLAAAALNGNFLQRDISRSSYLAGLGGFDLCICLATLQHIPGKARRRAALHEMADHLLPMGRIFLSSWQFAHSERQKRKIVSWSEAGIRTEEVDHGDYLVSWQRNGRGLRYVHQIDSAEIAELARDAGLEVLGEFRSDGREGDLNLYSILA